jgi:hypothetical protein
VDKDKCDSPYIWYVDPLEMALEQISDTLDSVEAAV